MRYFLENDCLKVEIESFGAEIKSVIRKENMREYLWYGNPRFWGRTSPVLFPFGFLDDLVLWIWIIWHLKDILDQYWVGEKTVDYSKDFKSENLVEGVDYKVKADGEKVNNEE